MGVALPFPSETFFFLLGASPLAPEVFEKNFQIFLAKVGGAPKAPERNVPKAQQNNTRKFPFVKSHYTDTECYWTHNETHPPHHPCFTRGVGRPGKPC